MFESVVAVLPIVICFQSLVLDMAGNVGTQSLAVTIRVLMDEDLTAKKKVMLLFKEMKIGFLNGASLGIMALVILGIYIHLCKNYVWTSAFLISGCVGISLVVAMVISKSCRHDHSYIISQDPYRSCCSKRSADHNDQRSCCCNYLLWTLFNLFN